MYGNMFQDSQLFDPGTGAENDVIWPTGKILIWYSSFSIWGKAIFFLIFNTLKPLGGKCSLQLAIDTTSPNYLQLA